MSSKSIGLLVTTGIVVIAAGISLSVASSAPAPAPSGASAAKPAVTPTVTVAPAHGATAAPANTAAIAAPAGPPGKAEMPETSFDAGTVERGAEVSHAFVIKNVGTNPLTVDAKPG